MIRMGKVFLATFFNKPNFLKSFLKKEKHKIPAFLKKLMIDLKIKTKPIIKKIPEIFKIKILFLFSCCKIRATFFKKGLRGFRPFS